MQLLPRQTKDMSVGLLPQKANKSSLLEDLARKPVEHPYTHERFCLVDASAVSYTHLTLPTTPYV